MKTHTKTEGKTSTESVGVTETQKRRKFREEHIARHFSELTNHDQTLIYELVWSLKPTKEEAQ